MFEPMNFVKNLSYMGKGMLSIMIVMAIVILLVVILNKTLKGKNDN
ncbi:MAG: hypothetical protein IKK18_05645 [Clostridia bacterium]|nr:hypothetical protein [Clostridia bacterium]